jgi:apolipoprotein N-acyltransferase
MLERFAQSVLLMAGARRILLAILAGAIAALAMPPIGFFPALAISFPLAIWLLDGSATHPRRFSRASLVSAFSAGWGFGFGYFLAGLWWLGAAFLVEDDQFAWALPLGVVALPAALALIHAAGFVIARLFWSQDARRVLAFAASMGLVEWLRSWIFSGFPWNSFGQALAATDSMAQIASLIGLFGMTPLAVMIFGAPAVWATGQTIGQRWRLPVVALALLTGLVAYGMWRLERTIITLVPDVKLRIMQPNLGQREKHRISGQEVLSRYLKLSDRATTPGTSGIADITHLIWPESPFPFLLAREPQALAQMATLLQPRTTLITGAVRAEDAGGAPRYFNSIHVVGSDGTITDSYDKVHLVPFGEYLPFRHWLDRMGLRQFVEVPGGFDSGARRKPLNVRGLPSVWPLICYEAVFPMESSYGGARQGMLLNVTNDAWFGLTFGPYQHLAQARLRSIEQGLPLVRAANTGISAVIDPLGRSIAALPLGTEGVLDAPLPRGLRATVYSSLGDLPAFSLILMLFTTCSLRRRRYP